MSTAAAAPDPVAALGVPAELLTFLAEVSLQLRLVLQQYV